MTDTETEDSTAVLLRKARERRAMSAKAASFLQREKTGAEKLAGISSGASIASGINSPTVARKTYTSSAFGGNIGSGVRGGVAGGVRGARTTPQKEVKAVPLKDIEDDFESLQEKMQSRFKRNAPDFKENLLSPNSAKRTFFDNPTIKTPLSPSKQNKVLSPNKRFFPDIQTEPAPEPKAPKRTTSKLGDLSYRPSPEKKKFSSFRQQPAATNNKEQTSSPTRALSPTATTNNLSPKVQKSSPTRSRALSPTATTNNLSPKVQTSSPTRSRALSPTATTNTFTPRGEVIRQAVSQSKESSITTTGSPIKKSSSFRNYSPSNSPTKKHEPVKSPATFRSGSPVRNFGSPVKKSNSFRNFSPSSSPTRKHDPVKSPATFRNAGNVGGNRNEGSPKFGTSSASPGGGGGLRTMPSIRLKPNSVVSRALAKLEGKSNDSTDDYDEDEPLPEVVNPATPTFVKPAEPVTEGKAGNNRTNTTAEDSMFIRDNMDQIQNDLAAIKSDVESSLDEEDSQTEEKETAEESIDGAQEEDEVAEADDPDSFDELCDAVMPEEEPVEEDERMETEDLDDSLEDLCNDVMPTPPKQSNDTEDSEWLDFSPDVNRLNTSLKRDADCLADSVFSSMESFASAELTPTVKEHKKEVKVMSSIRAPAVKKLRRSMSVSDIHDTKSPARFVRLDALRSSSSSLAVRSSYYSTRSSSVSSREEVPRKANTYKGPLEEGTLELRPPFEQVKVLEQGIMVQTQLEAQATQLLEHCNYGLEQVEAEKLQLIAGLKKELWKFHLSEVKEDGHVFSSDHLPKGHIEIRDIALLLRQDYLVNQVVETKRNQAFFVAVKVSPYRLLTTNTATSECNIHGTSLAINEPIIIENLPPNYKLTLEVYCMTYNMLNNCTPAKKKKAESSKTNTPKRLLQSALNKMGGQKSKTDRTFTSSLESYRGSTLGTPSTRSGSKTDMKHGTKFVLAGSLHLTIKDVKEKKKQFRLRRAPFHSPFEGTINLSMTAKESVTSEPPSHKGFLTIFQEESGLGAWNRRWCSVQDNKIYYWLYPEDEVNMNKEPHGEIDLRNCKTERVSVASRLDCARPNTFVLVILAASQPGDRNSIITETNSKTTQTKYLLSADSRDERKQWMEVLNKCLLTVLSWNH